MIHKSEPSSRVDTKVPSSQNIRVRQRGRGGGQRQRTRSNIFDRDPLEIRLRVLAGFRTGHSLTAGHDIDGSKHWLDYECIVNFIMY